MYTKSCSKCKIVKQYIEFCKKLNKLTSQCKLCEQEKRNTPEFQARVAKNNSKLKVKIAEATRKNKYYKENREEIRTQNSMPDAKATKKARQQTPEYKAREKAWLQTPRGQGLNCIKSARYRAAKLKATPKWLTQDHLIQIRRYYTVAKWIESILEEPIEVDHIVPLKGKEVRGLHVPWNLQLLTEEANIRKSNKNTLNS